jgi:CSLREA domain-containing protein
MSSASRSQWTSLLVGLLLGASVLLPPPLGPRPALATGTITVTTTADEFGPNPAGCSLREAIQAANSDLAFGGCPAGSGIDTIVLQASQTYALTSRDNNQFGFTGAPVIQSTIVIEGNGATITRANGAPSFRLFSIAHGNDPLAGGNPAGPGDLTLRNVTLSNGAAVGGDGGRGRWGGGGGAGMGGAIYVRGKLPVERSTLTNNLAQGGNGGAASTTLGGAGGGGGDRYTTRKCSSHG